MKGKSKIGSIIGGIILIIALVPVMETLSVIIQVVYFKKTRKRFIVLLIIMLNVVVASLGM